MSIRLFQALKLKKKVSISAYVKCIRRILKFRLVENTLMLRPISSLPIKNIIKIESLHPNQSPTSENFSKFNLQSKISTPDSSINHIHFRDEQICIESISREILLSTPHIRPIMSQSSNFNHSPMLISKYNTIISKLLR